MQHTSAALSLNENYDSDVREDMSDALDRIAPEDRKGSLYRHSAVGSGLVFGVVLRLGMWCVVSGIWAVMCRLWRIQISGSCGLVSRTQIAIPRTCANTPTGRTRRHARAHQISTYRRERNSTDQRRKTRDWYMAGDLVSGVPGE